METRSIRRGTGLFRDGRTSRPQQVFRRAAAGGVRPGERLAVHVDGEESAMPVRMRAARTRGVRRTHGRARDRRETRGTILALARLEGFAVLMREAATAWSGHVPPPMLLWGQPDPYFRRGECERMRSLFPAARIHPIVGGGHFPQEDAARDVTAALSEFLS